MINSANLLNKTEAAKVLGISPASIPRLVRLKGLPFVRIGRRVLFDPRDIENFINNNKVKLDITRGRVRK